MNALTRKVPAWYVILVLLVAAGSGLAGSVMLSQASQTAPKNMPDFTLGTSPPTQTISQGSLATLNVNMESLNGFAGSVSLSATVSPLALNSTVDLNPGAVSLFTGFGSSRLTITTGGNTMAGSYTLTVTGTSGAIVHTVSVPVSVIVPPPPDFALSTTNASLTIARGSSGSSTILATSTGGFTGSITLTASVQPTVFNGPGATLNPTTITLSAGTSGGSSLVVTTSGGTPVATYTVLVAGASGSLHHSVVVTVVVR